MSSDPPPAAGARRFWAVAYALAVVLAAANLPTPLYPHYQRADHLSTATLTVVFAAYVFTVAGTLAVAGQVADLLGRRAVLVPALAAAVVSVACFATSGSLGWLVAGRITSGLASGALTAAGPAALVEHEPHRDVARASLVASAAIVGGLAIGPLLSGLVVAYAPWPDRLIYLAFLPLLAAALFGVAMLPADVPGAPAGRLPWERLRELRRPGVPPALRPVFVRSTLAFSTGWVGTAMFFALGPTFADLVLRTGNPAAGAAVVFDAFLASAATQLFSRRLATGPASRWGLVIFAVGMAGLPVALWIRQPVLLVAAAAAAGAGQGLTHRASQAALLHATPAEAHGQTAAAFYLVGYLTIAVVLISLGALIDASSPLLGLSGFAALTVSAAAVTIGLTWRELRPVA